MNKSGGKKLPSKTMPPPSEKVTENNYVTQASDGIAFRPLEGAKPETTVTKRGENGRLKGYTTAEVLEHDKEDDCWLIIDGFVYDVTKWIPRHPGGKKVIYSMGGRDATDLVHQMHPPSVVKYLPAMKIGYLSDYEPSDYVVACRKLQKEVEEEGFFVTDYRWYLMKTAVVYVIWGLAIYLFLLGKWEQNYWIQILGSVMLGLFWQQTAFLGHDAGHNCIFHNRFLDSMYGVMVGDIMTGISMGWWKDSHNVHHSVPNAYKSDPDIQHLPVFAVTKKYFSSVWSTYHKRVMKFDKISRFLVSYQHFLFYPVMALARFNLYIQGYILILCKDCEWKKLELFGIILYWSWVSWTYSQCLSWGVLWSCLLLSHSLAGVLHVQICLSHFSMEIFDERTYRNDGEQFFDTQLRTCIDINCPKWMDWFHGGLQFQTAHHIFPRVPRHRLRDLREKIEAFCKKHNRTYHSGSFVYVNIKTIQCLKKAALEARKESFIKFQDTMLWEGMCAKG